MLVKLATLALLVPLEPNAAQVCAPSSPLDQSAHQPDPALAEPEIVAEPEPPLLDAFLEESRPMVPDAEDSSPERLASLESALSLKSFETHNNSKYFSLPFIF
jgi:hypothetical protein